MRKLIVPILAILTAGGALALPASQPPQPATAAQAGAVANDPSRVTAVPPSLPAAGDQPALQGGAQDLPAPYAGWNVELTPAPDDPRIVELEFDSPALGLRTHNVVYVPPGYRDHGPAWPVLYFLHGTVRTHTGPGLDPVVDAVDEVQDLPYPVGPGSGRWPTAFIHDTTDEHTFLVVTPDTGSRAWCEHCAWVDGVNGEGVAAETHLVDELLPLVEAVFNARTDRSGRGVLGRSMGGSGAITLGFRHPDLFAFIGALSPWMDIREDPFLSRASWVAYTRSQGFGPPEVDEITVRNVNALDLAPQVVGANQEIVVVVGEGCTTQAGEGRCEGAGVDADAAITEIVQRRNLDRVVPRLLQMGLPLTYVQREGLHGDINAESWRRYMLDRVKRVFAEGREAPTVFSYKTVDRRFSIWGYDVQVERPNQEFVHLLAARRDGTDLHVAGTGTLQLATPATFDPGRAYTVIVTPDGGQPDSRTIVADGEGRLRLIVELGPTRDVDERLAAVDEGVFDFPRTRIEVRASR